MKPSKIPFVTCFVIGVFLLNPVTALSNDHNETIVVTSDESWFFSREVNKGWKTLEYDDAGWMPVVYPGAGLCGLKYVPEDFEPLPMWAVDPTAREIVYFRKTFNLKSKPTSAILTSIFDDDGEVYVNGTLVRRDESGTVNPGDIFIDDITEYVHQGDNVIAAMGNDVKGGCQAVAIQIVIETDPIEEVLLEVPLFKQNDERWGSLQYAHETGDCATLAQCGCVTTSIAMMLRSHGVDKDPYGNPTTPKTVNNFFKEGEKCGRGGCTSIGYSYGWVMWDAVDKYTADANIKFGTQKLKFQNDSINMIWNPEKLREDIRSGYPVILKVSNSPHWALATGIMGETFTINDPFFPITSLDDPAYNNTALQMRRYLKTNSDFSSFKVISLAPTQFIITDPNGNKTGYEDNYQLSNIPNSTYKLEKKPHDDTTQTASVEDNEGVYVAYIDLPKAGLYTVKTTRENNTSYSFAVYGSDRDAGVEYSIFEGASDGNYVFEYNPEPESEKLIQQIDVDIKPKDAINTIACNNKNLIVPVAILTTNTFDAATVNHTSVKFEGAQEAHIQKGKAKRHEEDVDNDGDVDLIFHFKLSDTHLTCETLKGELRGETYNGIKIKGSDNIRGNLL